jgi:hypothetical protein
MFYLQFCDEQVALTRRDGGRGRDDVTRPQLPQVCFSRLPVSLDRMFKIHFAKVLTRLKVSFAGSLAMKLEWR